MTEKEIMAIIPARGGSKGIERKNMVPFAGKPLIQYTIEAARQSEMISKVTVNSDDNEILQFARSHGIEAIERPREFAEDKTPMKEVIDYQLKYFKECETYVPDIILLLQPTSPLRNSSHIDEALKKMLICDCDAMVSVVKEPHLHSPYSVMQIDEKGYLQFFLKEGKKYTSRQEKPQFYARNGAAMYAVYTDIYKRTGSLYGTKCIPYEMSEEESADIDGPLDLFLAECLLQYPEWEIGKRFSWS